ncbi:hypothetical protein [Hymenobacter antarcticus]|uniref:hypothetical protein n=1 Tax=Hymenobacter antarcticus TaxID=486270 RepID=UPI0031E905AA
MADAVARDAELAAAVARPDFYYGRQSVAEAVALLTQQVAAVRAYEAVALQNQAGKLGSTWHNYMIRLEAHAVPESKTVAPGELYQAELYLTDVLNGRPLSITVDGQPIRVGPDGRGHVAFRVPAGSPPGLAYWEGRIRAVIYGQDTTFRLRVPYTIKVR